MSYLYYKGKKIIIKELPPLPENQPNAHYLRMDKPDEETGKYWGLYEYDHTLYRGIAQMPADILAKTYSGNTSRQSSQPTHQTTTSKTWDTMENPEKLRELGKIGTGTIWLVAVIVIMVIALGGCGINSAITSPAPFIDSTAEEFTGMKRLGEQRETQLYDGHSATFYEYEDTVTGVHYLIFMRTDGIAMCPRYNADGTLYVSDESK